MLLPQILAWLPPEQKEKPPAELAGGQGGGMAGLPEDSPELANNSHHEHKSTVAQIREMLRAAGLESVHDENSDGSRMGL
ncbi:hypothetical protein GCM10008938_40910 [Deinococcus roseus]|uniref:Uncharacterized protein n=1 Tax=Deinococcus roseus TaxID=392414 RepID=A0ABQ2D9K5_9DEIO|nr:hypothetical protein GCM10008938_40910 [Deinococcus roseus]